MRYVATLEGADHEIDLEEIGADTYALQFGENRYKPTSGKWGQLRFR